MNKDLGQVFTKKNVADYMVDQFTLSPESTILDPCFGKGVFLDSLSEKGIYQVLGIELDKNLFNSVKQKKINLKLFNSDFLSYEISENIDGIIMNPPYLRQEKIDELNEFGITKDILLKNKIYENLSRKANLYMYFILKGLDLLRSGGELIAIFPGSWMNSKVGENFKKEIDKIANTMSLTKIIGDPFENKAMVDVVIMKLIKNSNIENCKPKFISVDGNKINEQMLGELNIKETLPIPFSEYANVRRGLTTGYNDFFINPKIKNSKQYVRDIISSPKQIKGYSTKETVVDKILLLNSNMKKSSELISYISKYESMIKQTKKPTTIYNNLENTKWYELKEIDSMGIWFNYFVRNDMKFIYNDSPALARDNFYVITPKIDTYILFALLNNYFTYFQLEMNGKKYGSGLLKLQTYDIKNLTFINIDDINENDMNELKVISKDLMNNGNLLNIDKITNIISKYTQANGAKIKEKYFDIKNNRLEESL